MLWSFYGFRYEPRANHLAMKSSLRAIREVAVAADRGLAAFHCRAFSFFARVLPLRIGRRAKHVGFLYQLCIRKNLSEGRVVLFPGGLRDQVQPEFPDFAAAGNLAMAARKLTAWREILFLTVPPAFYLFVAMVAGMTIGLRHILPMYAFLIVLIGGAGWMLIQANRRWAYAIAVLPTFQAVYDADFSCVHGVCQ
jgi:hypothetical protein